MEASPNEERYPFYDGEEIVWLTPPEYYVAMGKLAMMESVEFEGEFEP